MLAQVFIVLLALLAICTNVGGIISDDQGVHRKVVCYEGMNNFKNVKCVQEADDDPIVIGLHNIMFGYLNKTVNCSETYETKGCEERMSDIQTRLMLEKGSAQVAMNAVQFPAVDASDKCQGYGDRPDYMAFNFECLKTSSISDMCSTSTKSGQKVSVYNNGYPAISSVDGTHSCECTISSTLSSIHITLYDYQLNCTGNQQNLTIEDEHGTLLLSMCDTFKNGHYNSSNKNLTMVWKGQKNWIGLFWVGFRAADNMSNVTTHCYPIWDPTTTTTTSTTSTTKSTSTITSSYPISNTSTLTHSSPFTSNASKSPNGIPGSTDSSNGPLQSSVVSSTPTTLKMNMAEHQIRTMSKTVIYGLAGGGVLLLLSLVMVCVIALKRRNNVTVIDPTMMRSMANKNNSVSRDHKPSRISETFKSDTEASRRSSAGIELSQKVDKGDKLSGNISDRHDRRKRVSSKGEDLYVHR